MMLRTVAVLVVALFVGSATKADDASRAEYFEKHVRPILSTHCFKCHGSSKQKGGLRLDKRNDALAGGDTGKAIVPGRVDDGELLKAVRYQSDGYRMPPTGKLSQAEIEHLERWIREGAYWPESTSAAASAKTQVDEGWLEARKKSHWCWQKVEEFRVPASRNSQWSKTDVDAFLQAKFESAKVAPAGDANRYVLLRRLSFALVGLPPSPEELESFANDVDPGAYDRAVDRFLAAPAFGERWARHWLDLVRYSETLGHEFDFDIPNAWRYRDYVIRAINADLPYNQFVLEQIAGDLLPRRRLDAKQKIDESIIATAFWWFGEAKQAPVDVRAEQADHVDNQIDVFGKTFLGLTISCARCHDHKFDAISARDYYSLYGFLKSTRYAQTSTTPEAKWREEIAARSRIEQEIRRQVGASWKSQVLDLPKRVTNVQAEDTLKSSSSNNEPDLQAQWRRPRVLGTTSDGFLGWRRNGPALMSADAQIGDPVLRDDIKQPISRLHEVAAVHSARWGRRFQGALRSPTFSIDRPLLHVRASGEGTRFNVVVENFNVIRAPIYGGLKVKLEKGEVAWRTVDLSQWMGREAYIEFVDQSCSDLGDPDRQSYPDDAWFAVESVLLSDGPNAKSTQVKGSPKPQVRSIGFDSSGGVAMRENPVAQLQRLAADAVSRWRTGEAMSGSDARLINSLIEKNLLVSPNDASGDRIARLLAERRTHDDSLPEYNPVPAAEDGDGRDESIFIRGNSKKPGAVAPRRLLEALDGESALSTGNGSGRLALARRLIDAKNPLVARVFVNRVWRHLFGRGLVESPDNFGVLGESPTHRELLDHLATEFVRDGWSLKRLIRRLVVTRTFQLSSSVPAETRSIDPENKLFARANVNRLEAEALRDALLQTGSRLNAKMYGPGVLVHLDSFAEGRGRPQSGPIDGDDRRTVYLAVRRNFPSSMLTAFDAPIPAGPVGKRTVSNVPAQALILLNDPFVVGRARLFAQDLLLRHPTDQSARVRRLYLAAFGRPPADSEIQAVRQFLASQGVVRGAKLPEHDLQVWVDLCHAIYNSKEFLFLQ